MLRLGQHGGIGIESDDVCEPWGQQEGYDTGPATDIEQSPVPSSNNSSAIRSARLGCV